MSNDFSSESILADGKRMDAVMIETAQCDDRSAAIIGACFIEDALEECLRFYLKHNDEAVGRLFDVGEPALGTFSAKIDLCAAMGIVGPRAYKDLGRIRKIRNLFAHRMLLQEQKLSFQTQQIADLCAALDGPTSYIGTRIHFPDSGPRDWYLSFCRMVPTHLWGKLFTSRHTGKDRVKNSLP
jgi:hypothetical protein